MGWFFLNTKFGDWEGTGTSLGFIYYSGRGIHIWFPFYSFFPHSNWGGGSTVDKFMIRFFFSTWTLPWYFPFHGVSRNVHNSGTPLPVFKFCGFLFFLKAFCSLTGYRLPYFYMGNASRILDFKRGVFVVAAMRHSSRKELGCECAHTIYSAMDTREIRIGCHLAYVNFLCFKYITALDVRCIVILFIVTVFYIHLHSCGCLTLFH